MSRRVMICSAAAGLLFAASCSGETLDAKQWHFRAAFPCQSGVSSQTVDSAAGKLVFTMYSCEDTAGATFMVSVNDFPAGLIKPEEIDSRYAMALDGMAQETKGTIRTVLVTTLDGLDGREAIVDLPDKQGSMKTRIFIVGDRLYQAVCVSTPGIETGPSCTTFLNSFALVGSGAPKPASPVAK